MNLDVYQGDSFSIGLSIKDSDQIPMNLSGYGARGMIRERYSGSGIQPLNCVLTAPESGALAISLTPTQTSLLPCDQLVYDVEVYSSGDNDVFKAIRGYLSVYPEATYE